MTTNETADGRSVRIAALVIVGAVATYVATLVVWSAALLWSDRSFVWDAGLYWAVGRGMLNGLEPYVDVFENKPPAVFVLSALSFWLFDSPKLGQVLGMLALVAAPLFCVWHAWRRGKDATRECLWVLLLSGVIAGCVWSLFLVHKAGPWQTELFGSLFATLYVASIFRPRSWIATLGAVIGLTGAVGFKEPFLFSCAGAALLLAERPRDLLRTLLLPVAVTGVLGVAALFVSGMAEGYVHVYLPVIFGFRGQPFGPLWMRGFGFWRVIHNFFTVSWFLPLAVATSVAGGIWPFTHRSRNGWVWLAVRIVGGLYAGSLAVGLAGDYQAHHFGFFTPVFLALVALGLGFMAYQWEQAHARTAAYAMLGCWVVTALCVRMPTDPRWSATAFADAQMAANGLDSIMDQCGVDRYLSVNGTSNRIAMFALTRHSPLNQSLFQQFDNAIQYGQGFLDESIRRLSAAQIVAIPQENAESIGDIGMSMLEYIAETFTPDLPDCVHTPQRTPGYLILFRKDPRPYGIEIEFEDNR